MSIYINKLTRTKTTNLRIKIREIKACRITCTRSHCVSVFSLSSALAVTLNCTFFVFNSIFCGFLMTTTEKNKSVCLYKTHKYCYGYNAIVCLAFVYDDNEELEFLDEWKTKQQQNVVHDKTVSSDPQTAI